MYELWLLIRPSYKLNFSVYNVHNTQQCGFNYIHSAYKGDQAKKQVALKAWRNMEKKLT